MAKPWGPGFVRIIDLVRDDSGTTCHLVTGGGTEFMVMSGLYTGSVMLGFLFG
jgi:hypothetical protein